MKYGSLFSGICGLDLAVEAIFGAECAWHSEVEKHASLWLGQQFPDIPNLGDVEAIDWSEVEPVDIICGGSPCVDLSHAGRRLGMYPGTRSGLWAAMCRGIMEIRPKYVIWENVSGARSAEAHSDMGPEQRRLVRGGGPDARVLRALGRVLGDLAEMGYDAKWGSVRASDAGAPHRRERIFVLAQHTANVVGSRGGLVERSAREIGAGHSPSPDHEQREPSERGSLRPQPGDGGEDASNADQPRPQGPESKERLNLPPRGGLGVDWAEYEPAIRRWESLIGRPAPHPTDAEGRLDAFFVEWMMGFPEGWVAGKCSRAQAIKRLGNAVVPQQGALALDLLLDWEASVAAARAHNERGER